VHHDEEGGHGLIVGEVAKSDLDLLLPVATAQVTHEGALIFFTSVRLLGTDHGGETDSQSCEDAGLQQHRMFLTSRCEAQIVRICCVLERKTYPREYVVKRYDIHSVKSSAVEQVGTLDRVKLVRAFSRTEHHIMISDE